MRKFSSARQLLKLILGGGEFWVEKNASGHKNSYFFKLNPFSMGKYPNSMNHISITREATRLTFCIRHDFITVMTHAQFEPNRLMVTVTSGIRAWRTIQKAGPDRVKSDRGVIIFHRDLTKD